MSIQLVLLKSGEQIIADIQELVNDDNKVVSVLLTNPYKVQFLTPELLFEGAKNYEQDEVEHRVSFFPWIVLSQDKKMCIDPDWIVTVVKPHEWITESYLEKMSKSTEGIESEVTEDISSVEVLTEDVNG